LIINYICSYTLFLWCILTLWIRSTSHLLYRQEINRRKFRINYSNKWISLWVKKVFLFFRNEQDTFSKSASDNNTRFVIADGDWRGDNERRDESTILYIIIILYYALYYYNYGRDHPEQGTDAITETCDSPLLSTPLPTSQRRRPRKKKNYYCTLQTEMVFFPFVFHFHLTSSYLSDDGLVNYTSPRY